MLTMMIDTATASAADGILGDLQSFHRRGALFANVTDNVGNGVRLVAQVSVSHVGDAKTGKTFLCAVESREIVVFKDWTFLLLRRLSPFLGDIVKAKEIGNLIGTANGPEHMFHVMTLALDQTAQM